MTNAEPAAHPARARMKKTLGITAATAVIGVAVAIPLILGALLGYPQVGGAMILPVIAGLVPAMMVGLRTGLIAAAMIGIAAGLSALVDTDPILSALLMATVALATGISCRWGISKNLVMVPIAVGFFICLPSTVTDDTASNALLLAVIAFASTAWGGAVGWVIARKIHTPDHDKETWQRTWAYAVTLGLLTGVAAYISVSGQWGQAGAWFILTLVIIFQPYLKDSWQRTWQRAAGTLLGLGVAYLLHVLIPWNGVLTIVGMVLMVVAMNVLMRKTIPYWVYTSILTPAIILLVTTPTTFEKMETARLIATLSGAALALIAEAALVPLYRSDARRRGQTGH